MTQAEDAARRIAAHLEAVREALRRSAWEEARRLPVPLTPPQLALLQLLVDDLRAGSPEPSVSELTARMGLAHSTVSGVVDRLERRGLVQRSTAAHDRRVTCVGLTEPVREWVTNDLLDSRLRPLAEAMAHATRSERDQILSALATLERLVHRYGDQSESPVRSR